MLVNLPQEDKSHQTFKKEILEILLLDAKHSLCANNIYQSSIRSGNQIPCLITSIFHCSTDNRIKIS